MLTSVWSFAGRGSFSYTPRAGICFIVWRVGRLSPRAEIFVGLGVPLLFFSCWNLSGRYLGGDFLVHATCWRLSGYTSGGESVLLAPSWHLSRRSVGGECLLLVTFWNLSLSLFFSLSLSVLLTNTTYEILFAFLYAEDNMQKLKKPMMNVR